MGCKETQEKTIDGRAARCTPHMGRPGARLLARLIRHVAPVLGKLNGVDLAKLTASTTVIEDVSAFAPAIAALFEKVTPEEFESISAEILSRCSIALPGDDGQLKNYDLSKGSALDEAFQGELLLMFKVLAFSLEVNYAGFFLALGRGDASAVAVAKQALAPQ